jgi:preprotein translocase subunit SecE
MHRLRHLDPRLTIPRFDGRGREVANRKRRGEDAVDERLDEVLDEDALAEDEELDEELDDELLDEEDEDDTDQRSRARGNGRSGTVTRPKTAGAAKKVGPPGRKGVKVKEADRPGIIGRLVNFVREVVAELRKVIWPTRKELITYTTVVVIFVTIMFTIVAGLDYGFARAALWVFGGGTK